MWWCGQIKFAHQAYGLKAGLKGVDDTFHRIISGKGYWKGGWKPEKSILEVASLFERHLPIEPLSSKDSWHPDFICIGPISKARDTGEKQHKGELVLCFPQFARSWKAVRTEEKWNKRHLRSLQHMDEKSKLVGRFFPPFYSAWNLFRSCYA